MLHSLTPFTFRASVTFQVTNIHLALFPLVRFSTHHPSVDPPCRPYIFRLKSPDHSPSTQSYQKGFALYKHMRINSLLGWPREGRGGIQSTSTCHWGSSGISSWTPPLHHIHYMTEPHHTGTWFLLPLLC